MSNQSVYDGVRELDEYTPSRLEKIFCDVMGVQSVTLHPTEQELELYASQWNAPAFKKTRKTSEYFTSLEAHFMACSACSDVWHDLKLKYGLVSEVDQESYLLDFDKPLNNPDNPD